MNKKVFEDVLGTVIHVDGIKQVKSKSGEELQKRDITIVDDSGYYVTINLWGQKAKILPSEHYQHVLAVKGLLVRCFQGYCLINVMKISPNGKFFVQADRPHL